MHMMARVIRAGAFAAVLIAGMTGSAEAQLGRLGRAAKEKLTQAAGSSSEEETAPSRNGSGGAASSGTRSGTANFTADQLDRFASGLAAEIELRSAIAAELTALEPRPDYEQCRMQFAMSPQGQRALEEFTEAMSALASDMQSPKAEAGMKAAQEKFERTLKASCGPSPEDAPRMRQERQGEPARRGAETAGVDARGYALLKELVLPFCSAADRLDAGSEARIPSGQGKSYAYSADDTALLKPRCGTLLPRLQATL